LSTVVGVANVPRQNAVGQGRKELARLPAQDEGTRRRDRAVHHSTETSFAHTILRVAPAVLGVAALFALCGSAGADQLASDLPLQLRASIDATPMPSTEIVHAIPAATAIVLPLKTALLVGHLLGVVLGFGAALFLDFYLLRHLYWRPVSRMTLDLIQFGERLVAVGLAVLWLSGLGFVALCYLDTPDKLANPKLWAKIAIVCALTINGFAIHAVMMPWARSRLGLPLLSDTALSKALPLLVVGVISATSWFSAFALGILRELNFVMPGWMIVSAYGAALGAAMLGASAMHLLFCRNGGSGEVTTSRLKPSLG